MVIQIPMLQEVREALTVTDQLTSVATLGAPSALTPGIQTIRNTTKTQFYSKLSRLECTEHNYQPNKIENTHKQTMYHRSQWSQDLGIPCR